MPLPKWLVTVTPLSKTLALIIFISFPIFAFILGMKYQEVNTICISEEGKITSIEEKICQNKADLSLSGYDEGEIYKCGINYGIYPPMNLLDAPVVMVNDQAEAIGSCGGMPGPNGPISHPSCNTECEKTGFTVCSSQ